MINGNGHNQRSGLRIDKDNVDERARVASPNISSDNVGAFGIWVEFDTLTTGTPTLENIAGYGSDGGSDLNSFNFLLWWDTSRVTWGNYSRNGAGTQYATQADASIVAGTRYFLGIQSNGSTTKYYINGVLQTTQTRFGTDTGNWFSDHAGGGNMFFAIGSVFRQNAWAPTSFDGKWDEAFIINRTLTSTEWLNLYNGGNPISLDKYVAPADIIANWKAGDKASGSITTIHDAIGTNHLTSQNMEDADIIST